MMPRPKIAILYICTGGYYIFWDKFYASAQQKLFPHSEKHFFVFSDAPQELLARDAMTYVHQPKLGWPNDTLQRFHMFNKILDTLKQYDFIFFFNANIIFQEEVTEEILPSPEEGLLVVQHPGYYASKSYDFPYERNRRSTAYIPFSKGKYYICGGINGGTRRAYITMILDLIKAIDMDAQHGLVATWHDESHINKYILNRPYKILPPAYAFPENTVLPFEQKICILDKRNYGGHATLRACIPEQTQTPHRGQRILRHVRRCLQRILYYWDRLRGTTR